MDATTLYSFTTAAWMSAQALPLIIWPTFVSQLLTPNYQPANAVETYFARSLGLAQLAIGLLTVVLSGAVPLTSLTDAPETKSPFASPVILISFAYHAFTAFYSYAKFNEPGHQAGFVFGAIGSSVLAAFALWCLMFGGGKGHISRRTGQDKRTSGFPFKNTEAYQKKKRF